MSGGGPSRGRVGLMIGVVLLLILGVFLWLGISRPDRPLSPRSHDPLGTSALMALLEELGDVRLDLGADDVVAAGDELDVVLVLRDGLDDADRSRLSQWVDAGGVLVVADPSSALAPLPFGAPFPIDVDELDDLVSFDPDTVAEDAARIDRGPCDIGPLDQSDIDGIVFESAVLSYPVSETSDACFGNGGGAVVVATEAEGGGTVVALGGPTMLANDLLGEADNAAVAAALSAPESGTRVGVLSQSGMAQTGETSLFDLIPTDARRAMAQVAVAFGVYVLWRSRRVGKPVDEPQPVQVAGSELVAAVGLLERSGSPQHAAELLRADLRRDLIRELGLPADQPPDALYRVVESRTRQPSEVLVSALGPGPVSSDTELWAVAHAIDLVRKEVLTSVGTV